MSLNMGTSACTAARSLRGNPDWEAIRNGIRDLVAQYMGRALDAPADRIADNVGYTRALRDIHVAFESATNAVQQPTVAKVGPGTSKKEVAGV